MSTELLEKFDSHAHLRNQLRVIAEFKHEWAGLPMPITDQPLVIEPKYPVAEALMKFGQPERMPANAWATIERRGSFWCTRRRGTILIWRENGQVQWGYEPGLHHFDHDMQTIGASFAWGIEQEARALQLLAELLRHHAFKQYLLTGMFLETSPRSHVTYVFRKLRPTIALKERYGRMHILCALCQHPIGYYASSWAGAMCPTDDVISHLMLMRSDEPYFWRTSNQHPAYRPEAGL